MRNGSRVPMKKEDTGISARCLPEGRKCAAGALAFNVERAGSSYSDSGESQSRFSQSAGPLVMYLAIGREDERTTTFPVSSEKIMKRSSQLAWPFAAKIS